MWGHLVKTGGDWIGLFCFQNKTSGTLPFFQSQKASKLGVLIYIILKTEQNVKSYANAAILAQDARKHGVSIRRYGQTFRTVAQSTSFSGYR